MLYFSEYGWTLPNMEQTCEEFDSTYDQEQYEKKIARLITKAAKRTRRGRNNDYDDWWSAIRLLRKQDHYLNVMIRRAGLRPPHNLLRLWGTALVIVCLFTGAMFLSFFISDKYKVDLWDYIPSRSTRGLYVWGTAVFLAITYYSAKIIFGSKVDRFLGKLVMMIEKRFESLRGANK